MTPSDMSEQALAARDISERILEITGKALMSGDFDSFVTKFQIPNYVITFNETIVMETRADMARAFDKMHKYLKGIGVTDFIRECVAAEFVTPTEIDNTYVTHLIAASGTRMQQPYPAYNKLRLVDGEWLVVSGQYALQPNSGQERALGAGKAQRLQDAPKPTAPDEAKPERPTDAED